MCRTELAPLLARPDHKPHQCLACSSPALFPACPRGCDQKQVSGIGARYKARPETREIESSWEHSTSASCTGLGFISPRADTPAS